jgi:hypothetical protein
MTYPQNGSKMENNSQGSSDQNPISNSERQGQIEITPELISEVAQKVLAMFEMDLKINRERLPHPRAHNRIIGGR